MLAALFGVGATLLVAIVGSHVRTSSRLTRIETMLGLGEAAPDWQERERAVFADRVRHYCRTQCPQYEPTGVHTIKDRL